MIPTEHSKQLVRTMRERVHVDLDCLINNQEGVKLDDFWLGQISARAEDIRMIERRIEKDC